MPIDTAIFRWPRHEQTREGKKVITFGPPVLLGETADPSSLATCIPDEKLLFQTTSEWCVLSLNGDGSRVRMKPPGDPRKAALSRDGRLAAIAGWESGGATAWDTVTGAQLAKLAAGRWGVVEFSPDGRWLAATPNGVQLWDTSDWSHAQDLHAVGTTPHGLGMAFSPDSRAVAVGQTNGELRLVNPESGKDWARLVHSSSGLSSIIAFTNDNRKLVCLPTEESSQARVWDLAEIRRSLADLELDWPAGVLRISPDASDDGMEVEIEWNDTGLTLFQNAIRAIRGVTASGE